MLFGLGVSLATITGTRSRTAKITGASLAKAQPRKRNRHHDISDAASDCVCEDATEVHGQVPSKASQQAPQIATMMK
jgi:hypothetical protein